MPRLRFSWVAAFLAAVLIHAVVLAALSWKSDEDEAAGAASGGSTISVALGTRGAGDSATMVAPVSTDSVAAAESTPLSPDTEALPPPLESAWPVDPEALALRPPGDAETVLPSFARPAATTSDDATVQVIAPREASPAAADDRSVLLPPKEMTASTSETVLARAAIQTKPTPPRDTEPVSAAEVRTAATASNDSTEEVVIPREVAPALVNERETPLEPMETKVVLPAPAALTAAGSTARVPDAPVAVETVLAPPASIGETLSEASVAISVAPSEVQAAAAPDRGMLPVTREIAATPPPPARPPNMNVGTSALHPPADAENVAAQPAQTIRPVATAVGGSTVRAGTPREVYAVSAAESAVLSRSAEITVTAPAVAATQATIPASQQSRSPSTVETVGAPVSPTAVAKPSSSGARAVPSREITMAAAVERAGAPPPITPVTSASSQLSFAQVVETKAAVPVGPPETAAFQTAPDPSTAATVPPSAAAIVEDASAVTPETRPAVPRPVERPPRADVASLAPPSEPDAQGQEPSTKVPGARQSQKRQPRPDTEASSNLDEPSRSTGNPGQPNDGETGVETPLVPSDPGQAGTEVASLAIDLSGDDGVPDGWSEYLGRLQTWLRQHKEYPRRARFRRQEGTTILHFVIDRDGRLRDYGIERSSGHELLDRAVIDMIERSRPLPPIPSHLGRGSLALTVPVQFILR